MLPGGRCQRRTHTSPPRNTWEQLWIAKYVRRETTKIGRFLAAMYCTSAQKTNKSSYLPPSRGWFFSRSSCGTSRKREKRHSCRKQDIMSICSPWLAREHLVQLASTINNPVIVAGHEVVVYPLRLEQAGPAAVVKHRGKGTA